MKATLTFTLPDEQEEYKITMSATKCHLALTQLSNAFRSNRKYDGPPVTEELFWEILRDEGVEL